MNLIPNQPGPTPSYWCSWQLQNIWARTDDAGNAYGTSGHSAIAATLTESALDGIFKTEMLSGARGDLYALLDLGWDIPLGQAFDGSNWMLGSMIPAGDKFPSFTGSPENRLRALNAHVQSFGFRGLGLWIPANAYGEGKDGIPADLAELEPFYRTRFEWMRQAGIEYLKMDYGLHAHDIPFRRFITELAAQVAPDMIVEHAFNCGPFNDDLTPWDTPVVYQSGRFDRWDEGRKQAGFLDTVRHSRVFRTYDVSFTLAVPTTLDRAATILQSNPGNAQRQCVLNLESQPGMAAALGCAMGIMECYTKAQDRAARRAIRWQRIAPAWGVGDITIASDERLNDRWHFPKGSDWIDFLPPNYTVIQGAPAVVARNRSLPLVSAPEEKPYVACSRHANGAECVATFPRQSVEAGETWPLADIVYTDFASDAPLGIFGRYRSLTLTGSARLDSRAVFMQDLLSDTAVSVTEQCVFNGSSLTIPGELLERFMGKDDAEIGVVLKIQRA